MLWYDQGWARAHRGCSKAVPYQDPVLLSAVTSVWVLVSSASQHKLTKTHLLPQQHCGFDESALCTGKVLTTSV